MKQHLKLKEIIWEITGRCENGCSYCGSKAMRDEKINDVNIIKIADAIAKYPPEEIDISGGDPLLVSKETHKYIIKVLKDSKVKCKILFNPKSMSKQKMLDTPDLHSILAMYDWVGVSINTEEERELLKNCIHNSWKNKITIISNFNLQNIFSFDKIKEYVKEYKTAWQIQYTMYEDPNNELALYKTSHNNASAREYLFERIDVAIKEGINVLLADNINNGGCGAGLCSLGITSNGTVIPCLSMRSWNKDIAEFAQDNILGCDLEIIWKHQFKQQRFGEFKCCKDHCGNCAHKSQYRYLAEDVTTITNPPTDEKMWVQIPCEENDRPMLYGVYEPMPSISVYAVQTGPTFIYGVPDSIKGKQILYGVWSQASRDSRDGGR